MCEIFLKNYENLNSNVLLDEISKINYLNTSYSDFFEQYLIKNRPCVITNIACDWPVCRDWVKKGIPNYYFLLQKYKDYEVTISDCKQRYFNAQKTEIITFNKYITYWENYVKSNYSHEMPLLYLKDWHLRTKSNENFYDVPIFFASDWLNEFFSEKTADDYKFVYMGPKGTWTPFHADVFTSFSWSVNVCGKKKWILFPPGVENSLKDLFGNLPYDVTMSECSETYFEIIQNQGDAIFIPSGWHHQVWNLEDTISINHNWVNGCNVKSMWFSIVDNLKAVKKEIFDCKEMDEWLEHCQIMLKASHGIDFQMFYQFLCHIADKRRLVINENYNFKQFDTWALGKNHAVFDLMKIKEVLELIINNADILDLNFMKNIETSPTELLITINNLILNSSKS